MRLRSQVVVVAIARYLFTFMRWDHTLRALSSTLSLSLCVYRSSQLVSAMTLSQQAGFCLLCSIPENLFVMHKHTLSFCTRSLSAAAQRSSSSSSNCGLLVCFVFELLPVLLLRSKPTAVRSIAPFKTRRIFLCVCVCTCACAVAKFN